MKTLALLFCILWPFSVTAHATASDTDTPRVQIKAVIEDFRTAIIDHDSARFTRLFLHETPIWQRVLGDEGLKRLRAKNPAATKVAIDPEKTYRSFIEGIVADSRRTEETFGNIRIDTDGDIASVYFDYSFNADGRMTNYGKEAWHLVNTGDGWKIVSVIWSVNPVFPKTTP
ncbi:Cif family virulence factor [Lysobacter fragariae]